jgi:hypothetical protein
VLANYLLAICRRGRFGRVGSRAVAAQHQIQNGERQLQVVGRQSLCLLPEQTALQALVFFLQQANELLVLVALVLELSDPLHSINDPRVHGFLLHGVRHALTNA